MKRLFRNIKAWWLRLRRDLRLQRWPVTDKGTDTLSRMKQKLEKLLFKSK